MPTNIYDNKYHYQKDLGSGGFGRVFLAKEEVSGKPVAIKELNSGQGVAKASIIREIKAISAANFSQTMPAVSLASMPLSISMRVTIEI